METSTLPPGPPQATRPPASDGLRRSRSRVLGGVAAGIAQWRDIDPVVVRVALASPLLTAVLSWLGLVLAEQLLGGLGVPVTQLLWIVTGLVALGYLVAWFAIPDWEGPSMMGRLLGLRGVAAWVVGAAALVAAGLVGLVFLGLLIGAAAAIPAYLLVLFALVGMLAVAALVVVLVITQGRSGDPRRTPAPGGAPHPGGDGPEPGSATPPVATGQPASPWAETVAHVVPAPSGATFEPTVPFDQDHALLYPTAPIPSAPVPSAPVPDAVERARAAAREAEREQAAQAEAQRRARTEEQRARRRAARALRRERNRWGWLVASVTLITAGALLITDRLGATDLGGLGIGVACLALLTAGVLVGAWFGSARWLILPALLLSVPLAAAAYLTTALDHAGAATPLTVAPTTLPTGQSSMTWESGAVTVDLTATKELDARALTLQVDRGSLTVIVPADQWVGVSAEVLVGTNQLVAPAVTVGDVGLASSGYREIGPSDGSAPLDSPPTYLYLNVGIGDLAVVQKES